jgi:hypothetical protein
MFWQRTACNHRLFFTFGLLAAGSVTPALAAHLQANMNP